jgi:hypothetical protein
VQRTARERDGLTRPTAEEPCDAAHFDEMRFHRPCWGGFKESLLILTPLWGNPGVGASGSAQLSTGLSIGCGQRARVGGGRVVAGCRSTVEGGGAGKHGRLAALPTSHVHGYARAYRGGEQPRTSDTRTTTPRPDEPDEARSTERRVYLSRTSDHTMARHHSRTNARNVIGHQRRTGTTAGEAPPCR